MKPTEPSSKPKVLMLLSNGFNPDPRVHREAAALVRAGYQVTILGWDRDLKSLKNETIDGINVERIYVKSTHGRGSSQALFLLFFWFKAFWHSLNSKFDIVHAHDFDTLPLGYLLAKIRKAKLVYDSHESYIAMMHTLPAAMKKGIIATENYLLKRCDLVITVGEILQNHLESRGAEKICVVGNWQDPDKFSYDHETLSRTRQELGIKENQKVISFIANLGAERKVPELIAAVSRSPEIFLVLGGDGPCRELAEKAAEDFPNIVYLGYVNPARIPLYTALSDFIFYGFDQDNPNAKYSAPNKLFEGLAAGKIIITGDFGEIGRIVREYKCGIVLQDYSKENITRAISGLQDEQARQLAHYAKEIGQNLFNWSRAEEILLKNYSLLF